MECGKIEYVGEVQCLLGQLTTQQYLILVLMMWSLLDCNRDLLLLTQKPAMHLFGLQYANQRLWQTTKNANRAVVQDAVLPLTAFILGLSHKQLT